MPNQSGATPPIRVFAVEGEGTISQRMRAEKAFTRARYPGARVSVRRIVRFQGGDNLDPMMRLLANPAAGETVIELPPDYCNPAAIEVAYRRSVVDLETPTGLKVAKALGVKGLEWMRLGWEYTTDLDPGLARRVVEKDLYNKEVQIIVEPGTFRDTLIPIGVPSPIENYDLIGMSEQELLALSAKGGWYAPIEQLQAMQTKQEEIGRPWRDGEMEIVFQSWGDHCFHLRWKQLGVLQKIIRTTQKMGHKLVGVTGDNAGAILFFEGFVLVIKWESHNLPSSIFPLGGEMTKHGGLLRDIIEMMQGCYPLMYWELTATRRPSEPDDQVPKGALHPRLIVEGAIDGTILYCNPIGVPNAGADYQEDPGYAKCWTLGGAVGYGPANTVKQEPRKGDVLILIGGRTGYDGIHGANVASADELTATMVQSEGAAVQIGHPMPERQVMTVTPVLRDAGYIVTATDLGAGGIECAGGELTKNCGSEIDLTDLPVKAAGLPAWVKHGSESQERFLIIVRPENVEAVLEILRRYEIEAFILGVCRDDRRYIVTDNGQTLVDMDMDFLWNGCPITRSTIKNSKIRRRPLNPAKFNKVIDQRLLMGAAGDYNLCSKASVEERLDDTVQGRTIVGNHFNGGVPTDAFVSQVLRGKPYGAVGSEAFNARWSRTDPVGSVQNIMALAISKAIAIGVEPGELGLCANWYTAMKTPEQRWVVKRMVDNVCRIEQIFNSPVVCGKDSSNPIYVDADGNIIVAPHTLVISTVCRIPDISRITTKVFKNDSRQLYLIRPKGVHPSMAGTVVASLLRERETARLPFVKDEKEIVDLWGAICQNRSMLESVAAIGNGGLFFQLLHGCLSSGLGANITLSPSFVSWDLLGECPGSFLVSGLSGSRLEDAFGDFECIPLGFTRRMPGLEIGVSGGRTILSTDAWPELVETWQTAFDKEVA